MRIWTGRAGSGKTTAILQEIAALCARGEGRQILLVPELNSHQMERRLAAATGNHGARTAEVLTFSRLADRVFSEVGGLAQQMLTPAGQLLTLQEAARRVQGGLSVWNGLADKPELLREALRLVDECKTCAVAPEALFAASEECEDAALAGKLGDLAQLLTAYERLCDESLPDPRDRLTHLRDRLADSQVLDGAGTRGRGRDARRGRAARRGNYLRYGVPRNLRHRLQDGQDPDPHGKAPQQDRRADRPRREQDRAACGSGGARAGKPAARAHRARGRARRAPVCRGITL